uniref:Uncharacterized protein n=1 Tax=Amphiprion percula TaxID=161767 RepID=A0A3P8U2W3_AMPPE
MTLLLLLILSSVGLSKNLSSQDGNVSSLSPDLEDEVPEIPAKISVLASQQFLASFRASRISRDTLNPVDHGKLKWKTWNSYLPDGAISIYNEYTKRDEYVCRFGCHSGFFIPGDDVEFASQYPDYASADTKCQVPNDGSEINASDFEILVNEDNFEILEWKDGYYGSVPQNSVRTCADSEIYVGKNKYGLGKVDPKQKCFFLPWGGSEYWYRSYKVLTINKDVESNFMTDIRYHTDDAKIVSYPPETMHTSVVINYDCNQATKSADLRNTIQ